MLYILVFGSLSKWQLVTLELLILHDEDPEPDLKKIFGYVSMISMFLYLLNYGPREYIIFPVFLSLYLCTEKVKVQSRTKGVYFLSFFFFFIYIYTGILLKEIRIEFFSILCYFILLKSIRNFVFINLDIFFTSVQKRFLHIQFLSKLMILSNTIFARIYWILFFPKMFECCLKIDSSYVYSGSLLKALAS